MQPIDLPELGNIRIGKTSRERLVIAHSEEEEARKLENLQSSEAVLIRGKGILGDLTIAEQTLCKIQSKYYKDLPHPVRCHESWKTYI